jgi:hypothetical protein
MLVIPPAVRGARGAISHGASAAAAGRPSAVRRVREEDEKQAAASSARVVSASDFAEGLESGIDRRPRHASGRSERQKKLLVPMGSAPSAREEGPVHVRSNSRCSLLRVRTYRTFLSILLVCVLAFTIGLQVPQG